MSIAEKVCVICHIEKFEKCAIIMVQNKQKQRSVRMGLKLVAATLVCAGLFFGTSVEAQAPAEIENPQYSCTAEWINEVTLVEGIS